MYYQHNVYGCGVNAADFEPYMVKAREAAKEIKKTIDAGQLPAFSIASIQEDIPEIKKMAARFADQFETILVLGTGGSSLGAQTLVGLQGYGLSFITQKIHFLDNIDPHTFQLLLSRIDLTRTGVIAISKSGTTAETLCQILTLMDAYGENLKDHFMVITEEKDSPLYKMVQENNFLFLPHHQAIGGRFSVFSNVGLLPAALVGVNIEKVRLGAQSVLESLDEPDSAPVQGAAMVIALNTLQNIHIHIMMPYIDRLASFGLWFRQLWAESLGKEGQGFMPARAMGTVDQHSQVQLYLDGPRDKYFTVITTQTRAQGRYLNTPLQHMSGRCMGDLMEAEQRATIETFIRRGCPTRVLHVPEVNELSLGALLMHYMLETVLTAKLQGINAFDQPAVEDGKILTRQYLKEMLE